VKIALLYVDALAPGGYPRDVRWLAGTLAGMGHDVSVLGRPGRHHDGLSGARVVEDPHRWAYEAHVADILHGFGLSRRDHLKALLRLRSETRHLVVSPLAHLMKEHVRIYGWKKRPVYFLSGALLSARGARFHYFSRQEAAESRTYIPSKRSFIETVGVFPVDGATPDAPVPREHLLFFGRNDVHQKGLDILVKGYERALADGLEVPLVIGGRSHGTSEAYLAVVAARLKGKLQIAGETDDEGRAALMQRSKAFVFLSRWDGPPRPIREALALGVPAIVSPGTNMGDLVSEHGAGAQVTDVASVAAALRSAADDGTVEGWRAGAARLRDALAWPTVAEGYVGAYERSLEGG